VNVATVNIMLYNASFALSFKHFINYISQPEEPFKPSAAYEKRQRQVFFNAEESEVEKYTLAASKLFTE
jgi:hypothetical protein